MFFHSVDSRVAVGISRLFIYSLFLGERNEFLGHFSER